VSGLGGGHHVTLLSRMFYEVSPLSFVLPDAGGELLLELDLAVIIFRQIARVNNTRALRFWALYTLPTPYTRRPCIRMPQDPHTPILVASLSIVANM
jgi:2-keto-4-pentenoate hydratase/2-oxohepta-3-ene-1,7-dioic acid hydratase in catechol pathway